MSISFDSAVSLVSARLDAQDFLSVDELFSIVKDIDGTVSGATSNTTYLLNSGLMPDGSRSSEVVRQLQKVNGIVSVTSSDVGRFLNSDAFKTAKTRALKLEAT